jgi:hypothetical protein
MTYQAFSRENLEEFDEELAIPEVGVEIGDAAVDSVQVRVDPLGEGFLLYMFTLD